MTISLHAVHVVQFFMFEARTLELSDISGVFGPNGSGKSSFIDAVQIAMLGANQRLIALNAQADESSKTTRSIRGYCLGQYGETSEQRVRDSATTYITLVWRDDEARTSTSMGVCLYASGDTEDHEVRGLYLAPGIELSLGDHLTQDGAEQRPRDWKTFRVDLLRRAKAVSEDEIIYSTSKSYIRAALTRLRGSGGVPDHEAFQRAFRFALRMRFDKSVDQIVRDEVLEARPTNVKRFREITDTFRLLKDLVEKVSAQINAGQEILVQLDKAADLSLQATAWQVLRQDVEGEQAQDQANQAQVKAREAQDSLEDVQERVAEQKRIVHELVNTKQATSAQRDSHAAHEHHAVLENAVRENAAIAEKRLANIGELIRDVATLLQNASRSAYLKASAPELQRQHDVLMAMSTEIGLESDAELVATQIRTTLKAAHDAWGELIQVARGLSLDIDDLNRRKTDLEADLERSKAGHVQLSNNVRQLRSELREHGIDSTPVCDVVAVADPKWEAVVESYLGLSNLEALIVEERHEAQAFEIYRGMSGRGAVYGAKIVMSSRFQTPKATISGTVAQLVDGKHPVAVAFVRNLLRDIHCATQSNEALAGGRTLTSDGMLTGRGTMERLAPPRERRLGVRGEEQRTGIELALRDCKAQLIQKNSEQGALSVTEQTLRMMPTESRALKDIQESFSEAKEAQGKADSYTGQLRELSDDEYLALCERVSKLEAEESQQRQIESQLIRKEGAAEQVAVDLEQAARRADAIAALARDKVTQLRQSAKFDSSYADDQWDRLLVRFPSSDYTQMMLYCAERTRSLEDRQRIVVNRGMALFGTFRSDYREHADERTLEDWQLTRDWVTARVQTLQGTELVEHQTKLDEAFKASQEAFRTDVAVALSNNLAWLEDTINRLNSVLKTCPAFSNGERYQFIRTPRPENERLLRFIKDIAAYGPGDSLLGSAGDIPEHFKTLLEEKSASGAAGNRTALDDYREFFAFDIEILREDRETGQTKRVGHLSKRIGPGSGGEHRAPLYVIAGAALASAYRLNRVHRDGIRLILLDEAFHRMDQTNITATMRYFEDLGLQVFLASPGENLGILTAFLHRYHDIVRDPENNIVMLTGHDVDDSARQLMRSDLVEFHPELLQAEILRVRSERGVDESLPVAE